MNLLVVSHRRSGTHLTIDSIAQNFDAFQKEPVNLDRLDPNHIKPLSLDEFKASIKEGNRIIKSHLSPMRETWMTDEVYDYISELFRSTLKIHVVRDFFDTMISYYHFQYNYSQDVKKLSIQSYLISNGFNGERVDQYWSKHLNSWLQFEPGNKTLLIKYEDWLDNYSMNLDRISDFLGIRRNKNITDIRLSNINFWTKLKRKLFPSLGKSTSVSPRRGEKNYFLEYFTPAIQESVSEEVLETMRKVDYKMEYLNPESK